MQVVALVCLGCHELHEFARIGVQNKFKQPNSINIIITNS